jgi:hypothetical protein
MRQQQTTLSELRRNAIAAGIMLITVTLGAFVVIHLIGDAP